MKRSGTWKKMSDLFYCHIEGALLATELSESGSARCLAAKRLEPITCGLGRCDKSGLTQIRLKYTDRVRFAAQKEIGRSRLICSWAGTLHNIFLRVGIV